MYAPMWLQSGFPLSEDLPLVAEELFPKEKETAVGAVDDARPDRWGERLIRFLVGEYDLSPAFDGLPSGQSLGFQQMRVGSAAADSTLDNALSEHSLFGLKKNEAYEEVRTVCKVVTRWKAHFAAFNVSDADVASLADQIDRPFLSDQRKAFG